MKGNNCTFCKTFILRQYVLVIAWCGVQYGIYFSSSFCFRHIARAEGECNIGNKMNEKNISHIARNCHAITGLSLGELNHRRSCTSQWTIWRSDIHSYLTSCRKHGIETNQTDNLKNHRSQTPFSSAKTDVLHQNFALHLELGGVQKCHFSLILLVRNFFRSDFCADHENAIHFYQKSKFSWFFSNLGCL